MTGYLYKINCLFTVLYYYTDYLRFLLLEIFADLFPYYNNLYCYCYYYCMTDLSLYYKGQGACDPPFTLNPYLILFKSIDLRNHFLWCNTPLRVFGISFVIRLNLIAHTTNCHSHATLHYEEYIFLIIKYSLQNLIR